MSDSAAASDHAPLTETPTSTMPSINHSVFATINTDIVDSDDYDSDTQTESLSDALQRTIYSLMAQLQQISPSIARICATAAKQMKGFDFAASTPTPTPELAYLGPAAPPDVKPLAPDEWNHELRSFDVRMFSATTKFFRGTVLKATTAAFDDNALARGRFSAIVVHIWNTHVHIDPFTRMSQLYARFTTDIDTNDSQPQVAFTEISTEIIAMNQIIHSRDIG
ncbi:MAG: hypothetical protein VXY99_14040, partial [Pseudomonadota bacterium]|nr:hypothetical protein [Pseudomonadota bacterium]